MTKEQFARDIPLQKRIDECQTREELDDVRAACFWNLQITTSGQQYVCLNEWYPEYLEHFDIHPLDRIKTSQSNATHRRPRIKITNKQGR